MCQLGMFAVKSTTKLTKSKEDADKKYLGVTWCEN